MLHSISSTCLAPASSATTNLLSSPASLCVFQIQSMLLTGPFMPDADFQTNRLAVLCPPGPVGLGLDCIDANLDRPSVHSRLSASRHISRIGSSFDCENSMASMKLTRIGYLSTSPALAIYGPAPEFNSLYDFGRAISLIAQSEQPLPAILPQLLIFWFLSFHSLVIMVSEFHTFRLSVLKPRDARFIFA
ncbi:hypothetical protein B0H14DRAFT_3625737 [Mycena olivaceomarginata]|nr:hypothetical protein B0H14DRAFT_3625737 [Mycena olivaceomarginata]